MLPRVHVCDQNPTPEPRPESPPQQRNNELRRREGRGRAGAVGSSPGVRIVRKVARSDATDRQQRHQGDDEEEEEQQPQEEEVAAAGAAGADDSGDEVEVLAEKTLEEVLAVRPLLPWGMASLGGVAEGKVLADISLEHLT